MPCLSKDASVVRSRACKGARSPAGRAIARSAGRRTPEADLAALGIHRISIPIPFLEAGGPVNAYAIEDREGGLLLFDSGLGSPQASAAMAEGLARIGRTPRDITRIVVSHGHIDHYGGAAALLEQAGHDVPVHAHPRDIPKMAEGVGAGGDAGGLAGAGLGMGAGVAMGQILAQNMQTALQGAAPAGGGAVPAAAPVGVKPEDVMATLEKLGELKTKGILTQEEFDAKKAELLKKLV